MKIKYFVIAVTLLSSLKVSSNESLNYNHVIYWGWDPGYIESGTLKVEPKGAYADCNLYLEFISNGIAYDSDDSLEIIMNFNLPEGSQIHNLWLWINDEPIEGEMYDKWTASLIYESIVQRRIDPAILTKVGNNNYNIKIFPLLEEMPRRIRIQYSTPVHGQFTDLATVSLPFNILQLSDSQPEIFRVVFKGTDSYHTPKILENRNIEFEPNEYTDLGLCEEALVQNLEEYSSLSLGFSHTAADGVQVSSFQDDETETNYYELMFKQSEVFDITKDRKAIFLFDYIDENCTAYSGSEVLGELERALQRTFSAKDSFNVFFSGMETYFGAERWIGGDSASIASFFDTDLVNSMNNYSNLPTLLVDGIDFLMNNGGEGNMVLIASSNSNGERNQANALIDDYLSSLEGTGIPIHIIDMDDQVYSYFEKHFIGGQWFRGNEYLYTRLSQLTIGEYFGINNYTLATMFEKVNNRISGYFKSIEVLTQTEGGYAFSNYKLHNSNGIIYNDQVSSLVGKYVGEPPFYVHMYGQDSDNEMYYSVDTIHEENIIPSDSIIKKIWAAHMIEDLFKAEQSTQIVNQIINTSIDEYILTEHTALLVLEPGFVIPDDIDEEIINTDDVWVDGQMPLVDDKIEDDLKTSIDIFPNPCHESATVHYTIPRAGSVQIRIYNSMGQLIQVLVDEENELGEYEISYNTSALEAGIYQCILTLDNSTVNTFRFIVK